jgi:hypothetical protein
VGNLDALAERISAEIVQSLRTMTLEELALLVKSSPPSLAKSGRRSAEDIGRLAEKIREVVRASKRGLRAEEIRSALLLEPREWLKPIGLALRQKWVRKEGDKRSTVYFAIGKKTKSKKGKKKDSTPPEFPRPPAP